MLVSVLFSSDAYATDEGTPVVMPRLESMYSAKLSKARDDPLKQAKIKQIYLEAKRKAGAVGGSDGRKIIYNANQEMKAVIDG